MNIAFKLGASVATLAVLTVSAHAADLYVPQQPFIPESPAMSWTGGYVGGHVGYGFGSVDGTITAAAAARPNSTPKAGSRASRLVTTMISAAS